LARQKPCIPDFSYDWVSKPVEQRISENRNFGGKKLKTGGFSSLYKLSLSRYNASGFDDRIKTAEPFGVSLMRGKSFRTEGKIGKLARWAKDNWQVLIFWLACAFAGWYLGARGYGMEIYFRITGINPQEWTPLLLLTAQNDPKIGSIVSLEGLTDWQGKPFKLPFPDKETALLFVCGRCGLEDTLNLAQAFQNRYYQKVRLYVVYIGEPDAEAYALMQRTKGLIFLRDPKLEVFERLNALYMPRFYLISANGTLRYLSPLTGYLWRPERWEEEFERISQLLGR
jgi:hypothetical protein